MNWIYLKEGKITKLNSLDQNLSKYYWKLEEEARNLFRIKISKSMAISKHTQYSIEEEAKNFEHDEEIVA